MLLHPDRTAVRRVRQRREIVIDSEVVDVQETQDLGVGDPRIRLYERALCRDPRNHFLLIDLAREYARHQRLFDADKMLLRILELYPRNAKIRSMVAATYAMAGCPQQAIQHYRTVLDLDPQHPESAAILAELSSLCGKFGN